jgi:ferric-dicitrate binding protein FerR (iron transport regulator)
LDAISNVIETTKAIPETQEKQATQVLVLMPHQATNLTRVWIRERTRAPLADLVELVKAQAARPIQQQAVGLAGHRMMGVLSLRLTRSFHQLLATALRSELETSTLWV